MRLRHLLTFLCLALLAALYSGCDSTRLYGNGSGYSGMVREFAWTDPSHRCVRDGASIRSHRDVIQLTFDHEGKLHAGSSQGDSCTGTPSSVDITVVERSRFDDTLIGYGFGTYRDTASPDASGYQVTEAWCQPGQEGEPAYEIQILSDAYTGALKAVGHALDGSQSILRQEYAPIARSTSSVSRHYTAGQFDLNVNITATAPSHPGKFPASFSGQIGSASFSGPMVCRITPVPPGFGGTKARMWSVFLGARSNDMIGAPLASTSVGGASRSSLAADAEDSIYFVKGQSIAKVANTPTGYAPVTLFAGNEEERGCTLTPNETTTDKLISSPVILGTDTTRQNLLVMAKGCDKIFSINTKTRMVAEWASLPTRTIGNYFLTRQRILVYMTLDGAANAVKFYRIDLRRAGNTPEHIHGNGACIETQPTQGMSAKDSPTTTNVGYPCPKSGGDTTLIANDDASKIWINQHWMPRVYRLDLVGNEYLIGSADLGVTWSGHQHCVASHFDRKIYCPPRSSGRVIRVFDPATETMGAGTTVPYPINHNDGELGIASMSSKLLTHYSFNSIDTVSPQATGTWPHQHIAGSPLPSRGDGLDPSQTGLHTPEDIEYNAATKILWVRGDGHYRRFDYNASPASTSTIYHGNFWGAFTNIGIAFNRAGDRLAHLCTCARLDIFNFSLTETTATRLRSFLQQPCQGGPAQASYVPPESGTSPFSARFENTVHTHLTPVYHTNGKLYFAATNRGADALVYESDTFAINRVAGKVGPSGYSRDDEGKPALGAALTNVQQLQQSEDGDLLVWDGTRLREITIATEPLEPKIYTMYDYSTIPGYTGQGIWHDAYYDESRRITYFSINAQLYKVVHGSGGSGAAVLSTYDLEGVAPTQKLRFTLAPNGLLILDRLGSRVLRMEP